MSAIVLRRKQAAWWKPTSWRWFRGLTARFRALGYAGASTARRADPMSLTPAGANRLIRADGPVLRARARALARNNPYAREIIRLLTDSVVHTGIVPRCSTTDEDLNARVNRAWARWAKRAVVGGAETVYGMQATAFRTFLVHGESLMRRRLLPWNPNGPVQPPVKLQLLSSSYLDDGLTDMRLRDGGYIINGIEFGPDDEPRAYWLHRVHPNDAPGYLPVPGQSQRVPADGVVHLFEREEPEQVRGVPWLCAVIGQALRLDDISDAERERLLTQACMSVLVMGGYTPHDTHVDEPSGSVLPVALDSRGVPTHELRPAGFHYLPDGVTVEKTTPMATGGYRDFATSELRAIMSGAGVPYPLGTGDLAGVSFSSARFVGGYFEHMIRTLQRRLFIPQFCEHQWSTFIEHAIAAGQLPPGEYPAEWVLPRLPSIDPVKDVVANERAVLAGFTSRTSVRISRGDDPDEVDRQIARDNKSADALQVMFDSDPRKKSTRIVDLVTGVSETSDGDAPAG